MSESNLSVTRKTRAAELLRCVYVLLVLFLVQKCLPEIYAFEIIAKTGAQYGSREFSSLYSENRALVGIISAAVILVIITVKFLIERVPMGSRFGKPFLPLGKLVSSALTGVSLQCFFTSSLVLIYTFFPNLSKYSVSEEIEAAYSGGSIVYEILLLAVVTPILEEVVFRGIIFTSLKKATQNKTVSIIVSAFIFGAAHMNPEQFFYAFPVGIMLAFVFERTGSLTSSVVVHMAFNGGSFLVNLLDPHFSTVIMLFSASAGIFILTLILSYFYRTEQ